MASACTSHAVPHKIEIPDSMNKFISAIRELYAAVVKEYMKDAKSRDRRPTRLLDMI